MLGERAAPSRALPSEGRGCSPAWHDILIAVLKIRFVPVLTPEGPALT